MTTNEKPFFSATGDEPLVSGEGLPSSYNNVLTVRYRDLEEISLRQEMTDLITGFDYGEPKENIFVGKLLLRNREGVPVKCPCWNNIQNEGEASCIYCTGLGYQSKEVIFFGFVFDVKSTKVNDVYGYRNTLGRQVETTHNFFTTFDIKFEDGDFIMKPILNDEGFINLPIAYDQKLLVKHTFKYRLDEGRFEYLFCDVTEVS